MAPRVLIATLVCGLAPVLAGCGGSSAASSTQSPTAQTSTTASSSGPRMGFEAVAIQQGAELAPAGTTGTGDIDGIHCLGREQLAYHIHAHLAVYVNGSPRSLPGGIGIPGSAVQQTTEGPVALGGQCIYFLHTHAPDGIIHVESPTSRVYTLGNFFDEWRQPLSSTRVGNVSGKITALVNGKLWTRSLRAIPLLPHEDIQFNIGSPPAPFQTVNWSRTQL
jgi:hypothetical protein